MSPVRLRPGARWSQAVIHDRTVYLAGQVAPGPDAAAQTRAILAGIDALLAEAGTDRSHLLQVTIWLADMADFEAMNAVWDDWLAGGPLPARATGEVRLARPDHRVEMIAIAALP